MENGSAIIIFIFIIMFCYIAYDSIPIKYTKKEESFGQIINKSIVRFEYNEVTITYYCLWWYWYRKDLFY